MRSGFFDIHVLARFDRPNRRETVPVVAVRDRDRVDRQSESIAVSNPSPPWLGISQRVFSAVPLVRIGDPSPTFRSRSHRWNATRRWRLPVRPAP